MNQRIFLAGRGIVSTRCPPRRLTYYAASHRRSALGCDAYLKLSSHSPRIDSSTMLYVTPSSRVRTFVPTQLRSSRPRSLRRGSAETTLRRPLFYPFIAFFMLLHVCCCRALLLDASCFATGGGIPPVRHTNSSSSTTADYLVGPYVSATQQALQGRGSQVFLVPHIIMWSAPLTAAVLRTK